MSPHRLQEMSQKIASLKQGRETLERMCHACRDDLGETMARTEAMQMEMKDLRAAVSMSNKMRDAEAKAVSKLQQHVIEKGYSTKQKVFQAFIFRKRKSFSCTKISISVFSLFLIRGARRVPRGARWERRRRRHWNRGKTPLPSGL